MKEASESSAGWDSGLLAVTSTGIRGSCCAEARRHSAHHIEVPRHRSNDLKTMWRGRVASEEHRALRQQVREPLSYAAAAAHPTWYVLQSTRNVPESICRRTPTAQDWRSAAGRGRFAQRVARNAPITARATAATAATLNRCHENAHGSHVRAALLYVNFLRHELEEGVREKGAPAHEMTTADEESTRRAGPPP